MYHRFFGFRENPFKLTPDPRFFYTNSVYQGAYDVLVSALRERKELIVLLGDTGIGKTILLQTLVRNLDPVFHCIQYGYSSLMFEDFLRVTCEQLGISKNSENQMEALDQFVTMQSKYGRSLVCIIDEAQNLPDLALQDLLSWSRELASRDRPVHVILAAQPELEEKLAAQGYCQDDTCAACCRLEPLTDNETGRFIQHRLAVCGVLNKDLITPEAIELIAQYVHGVPRLINMMCNKGLVVAYSLSQNKVTADIVRDVVRDLRQEKVTEFVSEKFEERQVAPEMQLVQPIAEAQTQPSPAITINVEAEAAQPGDLVDARIRKPLLEPSRRLFFQLLGTDFKLFQMHPLHVAILATGLVSFGAAAYLLKEPAFRFLGIASQQNLEAATSEPLKATETPYSDGQLAGYPYPDKLHAPAASFSEFASMEGLTVAAPDPKRSSPEKPVVVKASTNTAAPGPDPKDVVIEAIGRTASKEAGVAKTIARAEHLERKKLLTTPRHMNALGLYRAVLRLEPGNAEALEGISRINDTYRTWGVAAEKKRDWVNAETYYRRALKIAPEDEQMQAAHRRVALVREQEANKTGLSGFPNGFF